MIRKISTICFIILFLFLISAVYGQDMENETSKVTSAKEDSALAKSVETEPLKANAVAEKKVVKEKVKLGASNLNMYYKDGSKFSATLKDKNNKAISNAAIKITISGKTYTAITNKKGLASLSINLKSGKYPVLTSFEGLGKYEKQSVKSTVIIKSTIKCSDFKKIYKNPTSYTSTFYDKKGKILKNTPVKLKLISKVYSTRTDSRGIAKLNIYLKPGKYSITSMNIKTSESITKTVTILAPITENKDIVKYYKNSKEYSVKIITPYGKSAGKGKTVIFNVKGVNYKKITDKNGYAKINVNLNPGTYTVKAVYDSCSVSNKVQIKSLIESKDLTMNHESGAKFNVKVYTSQAKAAANQKVVFKVAGKSYSRTSNSNGIASLDIGLDPGTYEITTEYAGLKSINKIKINKVIKKSDFKHSILIPDYVNVTLPYVFHNAQYSLKTGYYGIVKMPKIEVFIIETSSKQHMFSTKTINGVTTKSLQYTSYLIPFDGSEIRSDYDKNNLKGNGILISKNGENTQIDYISQTSDNTELFGVYFDKGSEGSETIKYMQNEKITAKITFLTYIFDEYGVKYSLAKYYGRSIDYFTYSQLPDKKVIRFTNTNEPVTLNYFESSIVGYATKEDITTKFTVNNKEELEKPEKISYGLDKAYRSTFGFEVLQSYAIITEKITKNILNDWTLKSSMYLNRIGVSNVYGMFLASLESCWIGDEIANSYVGEYNVKWKRENTLTILGGINLEDTYLHILNADMAMKVTGNDEKSTASFRLLNSICLPYIEDYVLSPISERYNSNCTNSLDNVLSAVGKNNYTTLKLGEMLYIFSEDGTKSAIILNSTSGVANVIINRGGAVYKGSGISTATDCCSVCQTPNDILNSIKEAIKIVSRGFNQITNNLNKIHPFTLLAHTGVKFVLGKVLTGTSLLAFNALSFMEIVQAGGNIYREKMIDKKDWYTAMDTATFTRPGYFQGKKIYNIPKANGRYDYIEVKINDDLTLNRDNALYISEGKTKQLTKAETYNYFTEEIWTPFNMPAKYWDKSWSGGKN